MKRNLLHQNAVNLEKQLFWLEHSYNECRKTGLRDSYEIQEYDSFEILSSRFARSIDFLVRKVFRSVDDAEFEAQGTLIDVVNNAHKRGLFEDIEEIKTIKDIKNDIAHEYIQDELAGLFKDLMEYTPVLINIIQNTLRYIKDKHS